MKRTWVSSLVVAVILGLLTLFLALQYKWLSEVSVAERERMQKRVETDTSRFAEDFNREMHAAYYNFQTDAAVWKNADWSEFSERYDFWRSRTAYPELIEGIYFLSRESASPMRYDRDKRVFQPSEPTPELQALSTRFSDENLKTVYDDAYALVMPVYESDKHAERVILRRSDPKTIPVLRMPASFGWVVVKLDEQVVKDRLLPDLAGKYFGSDYKLSVSNKSGGTIYAVGGGATTADASAPVFNMSPDNLLFFAGREAMPRTPRQLRSGMTVNQRVESHTFSRGGGERKTDTFQLELKKSDDGHSRPRTAMMARSDASGSEPWTVNVQHVAGSIDSFVRGERNKSFMIGLGIYLLLVGGILAILLSAIKSRRFAQRQIDFVSSVSHEFRTPLAVIYSAGENLADGVAKEDSQVSRYGELIKGEGRKLSAMVEQILAFAGANSGKRKFNFVDTDVAEVVREAVEECRPLIESGGFTLETDVQENIPEVMVDRNALSSAIQNLIANSVKYSNGARWIRISARNGDGSVKIAVEDRGIGISGDELKLVFEPFYRTKEVVDAQISGNGLGLNLVKNIAEAHGGRVTVESRPGVGSKFTIDLPQHK